MATDFNNNNTTIATTGGIKPTTKDTPGDIRTRVKIYADIPTIPYPYVGMDITVEADETNNGKMTDYKVLSLKANALGVADMVVDQVQRMAEYIGISSSSGGLTTEQAQQLQTAYEHSQTTHVQFSDIPTKTSQLTNNSNYATKGYVETKIYEASLGGASLLECFITVTGGV